MKNIKNVILISGKAQHGKDSIAEIIKRKLPDVLRVNFGDRVKDVCSRYFGWNGIKDENGRQILQRVGTNLIRYRNPYFWVNSVKDLIEVLVFEFKYFVIADCRFVNEIEVFKNKYGNEKAITIRVIRPSFDSGLTEEQKNHESETALDNYVFDYIIYNDGTLDDLEIKVDNFINNYLL